MRGTDFVSELLFLLPLFDPPVPDLKVE
uniref:Uncharacterized protein n=1 Tax=Arundo donax TaxID=35708 RepID=A0A0A9C6I8_ARUDO